MTTAPTPSPTPRDEQRARFFHDTYERLAPSFGYETRKDTKKFDPTTSNGQLMIAVCKEYAHPLETELAADNARLRGLMQEFVDKVDSGRARSIDSYTKFRAELNKEKSP